MPPGPTGLPILGNVHQMDSKNPLLNLAIWNKQFGDIFKINLLGEDIVVVSSLGLIKDVLINKQDTLSGRPSIFKIDAYLNFMEDVNMSSASPTWKLKKKAILTSMKMYDDELTKLEKVTLECIQNTLKTIQDTGAISFNPRECLHTLTEQILAILITTERLPEEQLQSLMAAQELAETRHNSFSGPGVELQYFPWLRHFNHPVWKEIQENARVMWKVYRKMIDNRKALFDINNPECVLDGLLLHRAHENKTAKTQVLTNDILVCLLFDLFEAGVVTTLRSTLSFIALLTNNPEIQEKIQKEIDSVIGNNEPRLEDRHEMHYISACIQEQMRYASIVPLLIPHQAIEDGELGQYLIPKGTQIWCNIWELNHDPKYWEEPWIFRPERFLDEQGHLVGHDHPNRRRNLLFGAGKRVCSGEVLAKNRLFLFMTCLLQKFKFVPVEGAKAPKHDPWTYRFGLTLMINDYEIIARSRSKREY